MGKGKDYELEQKNKIMEETSEEVIAIRPDYSGNSLYSVADVIVLWEDYYGDQLRAAFVELKKRSGPEGQRQRVMSGSSKGESGLDELDGLIEGTPIWGQPWVAVKFDHRELIVANAVDLRAAIHTDGQETAFHGARLTPADSISMVKPTLDDWNSSTAGEDDHIKLLDTLGVPEQYWSNTQFDINVDTGAEA